MEENKAPRIRRVIGVPQKREEATALLAECYARDLFGLEDYEHRIELVQAASTLDELEALVSDVPAEVRQSLECRAPASGPAVLEITVDNGVRKLDDQRLAAQRLALAAANSVVKLKYTSVADLPAEMIVIADIENSLVKIEVPPEVAVEEELENSMSVIRYKRSRKFASVPTTVRLRLMGRAYCSAVKIKTRRSRLR